MLAGLLAVMAPAVRPALAQVAPSHTGAPVVAAPDTGAAEAAAASPDSASMAPATPAPASRDSASTAPLPPTAARERRTLHRPGRFDQPRWVMLRSLLIPGWGQAHNHAWVKAALVGAGDGSLRWRLFRDERRLNDLNGQAGARRSQLDAAEVEVSLAQSELAAAQASGDSLRIAAAEAALLAANLARIDASDAYNSVVAVYNALLETSINRRWLVGGVVLYALLDAYVDAHLRSFDIDFQFDPALPGGNTSPGARLRLRWAF